MRSRCCVVGCSTRQGYGIPMHSFPSNVNQSTIWSLLSGNASNYGTLHKHAVICGKHFNRFNQYRFFQSRALLKLGAIPTVNLPVTVLIVEDSFTDPSTTQGRVAGLGDGANSQQSVYVSESSLHEFRDSFTNPTDTDSFLVSNVEPSPRPIVAEPESLRRDFSMSSAGESFTEPAVTQSVVELGDGAPPLESLPGTSAPRDSDNMDIIQEMNAETPIAIQEESNRKLPRSEPPSKRKLLKKQNIDLKALGLLKKDLTPTRAKLGEITRAFRHGYIRKCAEAMGLKERLKNIHEELTGILENKLSPLAFSIVTRELKNKEKAVDGISSLLFSMLVREK